MRILFLTPGLPYPPNKGTSIRNYNLIKQLSARHEVHLLSFVWSEEELAWLPALRECCQSIETVMAPRRGFPRRALSVFLSPLPDMALRLPSPEFRAKLAVMLGREPFDLVQVEGIELAQYGLDLINGDISLIHPAPSSVFDNHNAEYVLQQRAWEIDRRYPLRWAGALYSFIQWRKLRAYEAMVCRSFDKVIAVSEADRNALHRIVPQVDIAVVPNGVDCALFSSQVPADAYPAPESRIKHEASLIFTGTMDFRPNIDAVTWFCQEVLPLIKKDIFHVHFYIVGKSPPPEVRRLGEDPAVTVTGYVDDVRPYMIHSRVYVVPLRMGSGTRLKVLQAMAMGIPVVSTTAGAEGIAARPGEDILIADDPTTFAQQVVSLLNDEERRKKMAARGRALMEASYDWAVIVPRLERVYSQLKHLPADEQGAVG
ncbi:MAG: glycosyltransferase [Chloroflexi bacterium]|nr:glycosyltransferase [Chloroflexota bacterium]